jgi:hypothetical protein
MDSHAFPPFLFLVWALSLPPLLDPAMGATTSWTLSEPSSVTTMSRVIWGYPRRFRASSSKKMAAELSNFRPVIRLSDVRSIRSVSEKGDMTS